jgi:hypothetical protein
LYPLWESKQNPERAFNITAGFTPIPLIDLDLLTVSFLCLNNTASTDLCGKLQDKFTNITLGSRNMEKEFLNILDLFNV